MTNANLAQLRVLETRFLWVRIPPGVPIKELIMDKKKEKKIQNLVERMGAIRLEVQLALSKKDSKKIEINLAAKQNELSKLQQELRALTNQSS